jgi:hypothetical protein
MIREFYRNPKTTTYPVAVSGKPTTHQIFTPHEYRQAALKKIAPSEYRRRSKEVEEAYKSCSLKVGDVGYPHKYSEYQKMGLVRVVAICQNYDAYGEIEWHEPPYIMMVCSVNKPEEVTNCTAGWVVSEEPKPKEKVNATC